MCSALNTHSENNQLSSPCMTERCRLLILCIRPAADLHTLYGQMNYRSGGISLINLAEKILKTVTYGDTVEQRSSTKAIIKSILIGL